MNKPLFSAIFSISSTVLIGVLMVVFFVNDLMNAKFIGIAVVLGFLASLPVAFIVTKKLSSLSNSPTPVDNKSH